jgi:hypothetical protein
MNICKCNEPAKREIRWTGRFVDQSTFFCDFHYNEWQSEALKGFNVFPDPDKIVWIGKAEEDYGRINT